MMTTTNTTNTTDETTTVSDKTESEAPTTESATTEPEPAAGNREAAKYRTQLRTVEAERDTLTGQVEGLRRRLVEQLAADRLREVDDFWRLGPGLDALLDDDGNVDVDKVNAAVAAVLEERAYLARPRAPKPDMSQGSHGIVADKDRWTGAFSARGR